MHPYGSPKYSKCAIYHHYIIIISPHFFFPGVGSVSKLRDLDYDWQEPHRRSTTDDDLISPYSADSSTNELDHPLPRRDYPTKNGTYVIRGRTRKRERKPLNISPGGTKTRKDDGVFKRYSNTFDDIKSLLREGRLEGLNEPPPDFVPPVPPDLVRVLSLPAFDDDKSSEDRNQSSARRHQNNQNNVNSHHNDYLSSSSSASSPPPPAPDKSKCNGVSRASLPMSKSLDIQSSRHEPDETRKTSKHSNKSSISKKEKFEAAKVPVNVLIEDQIVKKALNENRRQLEKVSDAIKEIESVRNSENFVEVRKKGRREDDEGEDDGEDEYVGRREKLEEIVYGSGRRIKEEGVGMNDQRQIENVIDAILEDSKNPDFQVIYIMKSLGFY